MALPSYYSTGTATVAANGTAVTGQGTTWSGALQPGDLFGTHKGLAVRVASVNSNTSLTLAYPWPGAAQTASAYEVQIVPDEARVQEQTRLLLEQLASGNLSTFAALTLAADRLPYATGAGTMALTPLTSFGRSFLDDANASTALSTLGVSNFIKTLLDDADQATALNTLGAIPRAGGDVIGNLILGNNIGLTGKMTSGTPLFLAYVSPADEANIGAAGLPLRLRGSAARPQYNSSEVALLVDLFNQDTVGSFGFFRATVDVAWGGNTAGSNLNAYGIGVDGAANSSGGSSPTGTWKCLGTTSVIGNQATLFVKVA